jgi:hypothetical protein
VTPVGLIGTIFLLFCFALPWLSFFFFFFFFSFFVFSFFFFFLSRFSPPGDYRGIQVNKGFVKGEWTMQITAAIVSIKDPSNKVYDSVFHCILSSF